MNIISEIKFDIQKITEMFEELKKENERLEREVVRLKEYEWMYKDLCR